MDLSIPEESVQLAATARQALQPLQQSMRRPEHLHDLETGRSLRDLLAGLGVWELDVAGSLPEACAAALVAVECGRVAAPLPVAALVTARVAGHEGVVHAVGSTERGARRLVDHVDLEDDVRVIDHDGRLGIARPTSSTRPTRLMAPAAGWVEVRTDHPGDARLWAWHEVMSTFGGLGAAEAAVDCIRTHLGERHQFGKPLGAFQALQHRYADALRHVAGLRELALNILWRVQVGAGSPVADALALRAYHLEVQREVFRHAHQVHGALGFCYEHPVATLSMWTQFRRSSPLTHPRTLQLLAARLGELDMIFGAPSTANGHATAPLPQLT